MVYMCGAHCGIHVWYSVWTVCGRRDQLEAVSYLLLVMGQSELVEAGSG